MVCKCQRRRQTPDTSNTAAAAVTGSSGRAHPPPGPPPLFSRKRRRRRVTHCRQPYHLAALCLLLSLLRIQTLNNAIICVGADYRYSFSGSNWASKSWASNAARLLQLDSSNSNSNSNTFLSGTNKKLKKEPTRVSGYGSKRHKLPGSVSVATTTVTTVVRRHGSSSSRKEKRTQTQIVANNSTRNQAALYIQPTDTAISTPLQTATTTTKLRVYSVRQNATVAIQALSDDDNNKHHILLEDDDTASPATAASDVLDENDDQDLSTWIPVEGLYGVYKLPSGHVYVWIVNSECVYQAPSLPHRDDDDDDKKQQPPPWWQIRRVTELHLTRVVPRTDDNSSSNKSSPVPLRMTRAQRLEETRQLALLRQALKHHEWYFCGHGESDDNNHTATAMRIPDMTWNLQISFLRQQQQQQQSERIIPEDDDPTIRNKDTAYSAGSPSPPSHRQQQQHDAADTLPPRGGANFDAGRIRRRRRWWDSIKSSSEEEEEEEPSSSSVNGTTANQDEIRNQTVVADAGDEEKMDDDNDNDKKQQEESDTVSLPDDSSVENTEATNVTFPVAAEENDGDCDKEYGSNVTRIRRWWERSSATDGVEGARGRCPDSRFFWNEAAVEPLVEIFLHSGDDDDDELRTPVSVLLEHAIPVTSAFCGVQSNLSAANSPSDEEAAAVRYDQLLITRRGRFRAGTRFTKRGADSTGAVANYAETEQVLFLWKPSTDNDSDDGSSGSDNRVLHSIASHVQTRGSIPLRWSSPTDIKTYRPRIRIGTDPLAQARAVRQHLVDQASRYIILPPSSSAAAIANETTSPTTLRKHPALLFLNLIDKKSDQGRLGRALDAVLKAVLDVYSSDEDSGLPWLKHSLIEHMWFDFHAEVKSGRWDKLVGLLERVKPTLEEQDYCRVVPDSSNTETAFRLERLQTGVVRTNCMDCLDRTNVVQSLFGRYMMFQQLSDDALAGISAPARISYRHSPMTLPWTTGEVAHRLLWADNADAISRLYAGTPALKGDFTRTGKRTKKGALDDGMNSLQRYYLNNFLDADRQEGMDLLTGYQPFSNIDGDDSIGDSLLDNEESLPTWSRLRGQGMSVQEAARRMLLGNDSTIVDDDDDSGRDHERIKVRNRNGRRRGRSLEDGEFARRPRSLDLRWLPGDLQTQVRSLVSSPGNPRQQEDESFASEYLHAMDERSASDLPWWVAADSSASEADDQDRSSRAIHEVASASNNVGYLLGAFVAGTQKPLATAAVVVGLVAVSFPMTVQFHKEAQQLQDDE